MRSRHQGSGDASVALCEVRRPPTPENTSTNVGSIVRTSGAAFFVNAAILVLAAAVFWRSGIEMSELQQAHQLLRSTLGGAAATAFAVALLCSGQSSTITGTLAGQIVMEGFLRIRIRPWLRRLITRSLAIVPALAVITASGGKNTVELLVISQVVLSMQLPSAIYPLMMVTSSRKRMGEFANPWPVVVLGYAICTVIAAFNVYLLWNTIGPIWVGVAAAALAVFIGYVRFAHMNSRSGAVKTTRP